MKKRFAFFAFLCFSAVCLISGGGVLTSCKHNSSSGPAGLDLTMYKDSKNETLLDIPLTYVIGGEEQKNPYFYVRSLNYPEKNQIDLDSAVYKLGEDGDDEELDPDEDIAVAYKKAQKNYKITLHKMPTDPGSYDFTLSFSADNGQENELEFTVKVSKKTSDGGEITGAAPKITTDLEDAVGTESVTLKVVATVADGTTPTYQWYKDGAKIEGEASSSYKAKETGAYYVKVTANNQTVQSNTANVVIDSSLNPTVKIPKITINSVNGLEIKDRILKVPEVSDGGLSVSVVDGSPTSYQWYLVEETSGSDEIVSGATSATYTPTRFAGYYCKIVVDGNTYQSSTVNVIEKDIAMTLNPDFGEYAYLDDDLTVNPKTDVPCTFTYQWYKIEDETSGNSASISGATQADYMPTNEGWYECKVTPTSIATGTKGAARTTDKVYVRKKTADDPDKPTNVKITGITSLKEGEKLSLSVTADDVNGTLSYQWIKGNNPISGATEKTYEKSNVTTDDAGNYSCRVINTFNGTTADAISASVEVTVTKAGETTGDANIGFDYNQ